DGDKALTPKEFAALADAWFDKLDPDKAGRLDRERFVGGLGDLLPPPPGAPRDGGGRGGFGPAGFIGPGFFAAADSDTDGTLTRLEWKNDFETWFGGWDADKSGRLDEAELLAGLNSTLPRPSFGPPTPMPDDDAGFAPIFDGKTLSGWDGDPAFWRVEDAAILGESTPEKPVTANTFLIWSGGRTADVERKLRYKLSEAANSGVQYRSAVIPEVGRWAMRGYQADLDAANMFTGQVYEERGRGFLATRGRFVRVAAGGKTRLVGSLGDDAALKAFIKAD